MKRIVLLVFLCLTSQIFAQTSRNTTLIGNLDYGSSSFTNDVWGYTDSSGNDYALVGRRTGVSVVKVESDTLIEIAFVSGVSSTWRDIKTHGNYAYVTNESANGLAIIDLSPLPDEVRFVGNYDATFATAHNLHIADGYAYISGSNNARAADILDLANPEAPVKVGEWTGHYFHDIYVRNDTLFGSAGSNPSALVLLDVSDKTQPSQIVEIPFPSGGYVHNAWTTEDGKYVMTTEETGGLSVKMWDIQDPFNAQIVHEYLAFPSQLAHNTHIRGDFAYISHYGDGLRIVDISDPTHLVEVGYYDTFPDNAGAAFEGNWGAFPFTSSGYIYASDEDFGLFVVSFNGRRAARLSGQILDSQTGQLVPDVTLEITELGQSFTSGSQGDFKIGFPDPGPFTIKAYSFSYDTTTVTFNAVEGQSDVLDIMINERRLGSVSGNVVDKNGIGIDSIQITFPDTPLNPITTPSDGSFNLTDIPSGTYRAVVGKWGFLTKRLGVVVRPDQVSNQQIVLRNRYADNFELDLGWETSSSTSPAFGLWEIVDPKNIGFGLPFNPEEDISDAGTQAYYARSFASELTLISPAFDLIGSTSPVIKYYRHWFPRGGNNDSLVVDISSDNGQTWTNIAIFSDADATSDWEETMHEIPVSISRTGQMKVRFTTKEKGNQSCFALIDEFDVIGTTSVDNQVVTIPDAYSIEQNYPNPFNPSTTIRYSLPEKTNVHLKIFDTLGRQVRVLFDGEQLQGEHQTSWNGRDNSGRMVASGVYFYRIETNAFTRTMKMLLIQ